MSRLTPGAGRLAQYSLILADTPADTVQADAPDDDAAETVAEATETPVTARWAGPIGMEGELTGDGRAIAPGALRWDTDGGAVPIRYVQEDIGMHDGAQVVGTIDTISRRDGGVIWGEGDLDLGTEAGAEAYRAVSNSRQNGVSMDLDDVSFEIRVAADVLNELDDEMVGVPPEVVPNDDGTVTVATINSDDEIMYTISARVRAATLVAVPAFAQARIAITEDATEPVDSVAASAGPMAPPTAWFDDPHLSGPTPLTVTADGRVYGHLALWGTCHLSHTAGGQCVSPPNSPSGYAWFHTGALLTASGDTLAIGHLTMGTGHAGGSLTPAATLAHYDNTGNVAADVRAGEDAHGIWVAGAMRPHLTPDQVRGFRAAPLSGDWRRVGNALELVAALSVNVPGFGVPRTQGLVAGGNLTSLVASGVLAPAEPGMLSDGDMRWLRQAADRERHLAVTKLAARRNRIKVAAFARRNTGGH